MPARALRPRRPRGAPGTRRGRWETTNARKGIETRSSRRLAAAAGSDSGKKMNARKGIETVRQAPFQYGNRGRGETTNAREGIAICLQSASGIRFWEWRNKKMPARALRRLQVPAHRRADARDVVGNNKCPRGHCDLPFHSAFVYSKCSGETTNAREGIATQTSPGRSRPPRR